MFDSLLILSFTIGLSSGLLGGITGAGGGLIISPYLMLIGLPPATAVATPKLAGIGVGIGSLYRFRTTKHIDWYWVKRLMPLTIICAFTGSVLLLITPNWLIKFISLGISIEIAIQLLVDRKSGLNSFKPSNVKRSIGYVIYSGVELIRGAVGSGIGTLNMAVMMSFFGLEAVSANVIKRLVAFPSLIVSLIVIIPSGFINWPHGVSLLAGTVIGGYAGANLAIRKGNLFVKRSFLFVVIILAITALLM